MFALRRVAARAIQFQPARQFFTPRPVTSSFQSSQSALLYRSIHQSRRLLAEEEQKKESPAESEGGETVITEPSPSEVKEESIATPEVTDAAQDNTPAPSESAAQEITQEVKSAIDSVKDGLSSTAQTAEESVGAFSSKASEKASVLELLDGVKSSGATTQGDPTKILYVGNLQFDITSSDLEAEFSKIGEVSNCKIVTDGRGLSRGFGYVEFKSQDAADRAVRELDQKLLEGRRVAVQYHIRRERPRVVENRRENPPSKTLFIGNMSYQMSDRDLNGKNLPNVLLHISAN